MREIFHRCVATFLLVFLIQYSQNRNTQATQLKLDELVRVLDGARNKMIRLEDLPDAELDRLDREMRALRSGHEGKSMTSGLSPATTTGLDRGTV